ncbi:MAG: FHA domain-containing protein [Caldilineaceae bacterium]
MRRYCWILCSILIVAAAFIALPLLAQTPTPAASPAVPYLDVTGINASNVQSVTVSIYGENLGVDLGKLPITLFEDNEKRNLRSQRLAEVGIQTAFVLDASGNILKPGMTENDNKTKRLRYQEYQAAVAALVDQGFLVSPIDWLAAFTIGASANQFQIIADWTADDHNLVVNKVTEYKPEVQSNQTTPLFDLIEFTLDHFQDSPAPTNLMRSIIVFSDGFDADSALDGKDIIGRAQRMRVRIYTVMVGPELDAGNSTDVRERRKQNLEAIALKTGGSYIFLDSLDRLNPLWSTLKQQRQQLLVTYPLGKAQPRELRIEAQLPDRNPLVRRVDYPTIGLKPPQVQVVQPQPDTPFVRTAAAHDSPLSGMEPISLPITIELKWPDGHPRPLQRVEYTIADDTKLITRTPFSKFAFPIANLPAGNYTLRVRVVDTFDIVGESLPVGIPIQLNIPPAPPTPTPLPTDTATAPPTFTPQPTLTAVPTATAIVVPPAAEPALSPLRWLVIGGCLLFLAGFLIWRRRRASEDDFSTSSDYQLSPPLRATDDWSLSPAYRGPGDDATEVPVAPPFNPVPGAYLEASDPKPHLPNRILLHVDSIVRIGRRPDLSDVVLNDSRISRKHATITHKEDGFHIQDDGSKGGTWVNRRKLGAGDDRLLKVGDLVNFYDIEYRFVPVDDATELPLESPWETGSGSNEPTQSQRQEERTEPVNYKLDE